MKNLGSPLQGLTLMALLMMMAESERTDIYNFPMFGVIGYDLQTEPYSFLAYGSVTIVHKKLVLTAAENLFQLDPISKSDGEYIFNDAQRSRLVVYAGTDVMQPPKDYDFGKVQNSGVQDIYIGKNSSFVWEISRYTDWAIIKKKYASHVVINMNIKPSVMSNFPRDFAFDVFGEPAWDVAALVLSKGFEWKSYVLPIQFHWKDPSKLTAEYVKFWSILEPVEDNPQDYSPCGVPGWSPMGNNEIIYHSVIYIRFKACAEAICARFPATCLRYLNFRQHICFKSLSFADACVLDQGAPVICPWAKPNVLGILVKTFDCGTQGVPLVFTRLYAIEAFAEIGVETHWDADEPDLLDPQYTENPNL